MKMTESLSIQYPYTELEDFHGAYGTRSGRIEYQLSIDMSTYGMRHKSSMS